MISTAYRRQKTLQRAKEQACRKRISTPLLVLVVCVCVIGALLVVNPGLGSLIPQNMAPTNARQMLAPDAGRSFTEGNNSRKGDMGEGFSALPLLVSASHPLPDDYPLPKLVSLVGKASIADDSIMVAAEIEQALLDMLAGARASGLESIVVNSGYRSREEQAVLYEQADDKSYVQPPGASEHETGLAVDLQTSDEVSQQWLMDNAWRYGFIVRYPAGKEAITGISSEPWHFRYVGPAVAQQCYDNDLCLEEWFNSAFSQVDDD